jgi:cellulose synthase/poly-beta-1,6-N-acetylglucosamine synthase-like glycosyltransferase
LAVLDPGLAIICVFFAAPLVICGFYGALLFYYGKKKRTGGESASLLSQYEPTISVVIPTHNEEKVIAARIENLLSVEYPSDKMEVIFVDDSNDSTPHLIESYAGANPMIHLIRFPQRMGYTPSVVAGCKASKGEIIILAETSSLMNQDTIRRLVNDFSDPNIGVVTGQDLIINTDEEVGRSEQWYQRIYNSVRSAESNMDSTFYIKGEAAAVRAELIRNSNELENCPGTADTALALVARKNGFRAIYDPRVKFSEYAPSTHKERVRQKVNRGANLVKILWHFRTMFFRPKYGKFGMITLPINFAMIAIAPVMLLAGMLTLIALTLFNPFLYLPVWLLGIAILLFVSAFQKSAVFTIFEFEYSLIKGLFEIFFKKNHDKLEKIASTRRLA